MYRELSMTMMMKREEISIVGGTNPFGVRSRGGGNQIIQFLTVDGNGGPGDNKTAVCKWQSWSRERVIST